MNNGRTAAVDQLQSSLCWSVTMVRSHWLHTLLVITVGASQFTLGPVDGNFGLTSKHQVLGLVEDLILNHTPASPSSSSLLPSPRAGPGARQVCDMLKLERRQRRMCKRDGGVAGTLLEAVRLSTSECQRLFRYDRWNCSIGMYRTKLLREGKGFAETSMLHAISAAGLVHAYAKACSSNHLHTCTCANPKAWKWGGCGDNIKDASRFTRRFLSVLKKDHDIQAEVDEHNSRIGIRVVRQSKRKVCKCHGASGSCTFKTCWTRLAPFHETASRLKQLYERAERVVVDGNDSRHHNLLTGKQGLVFVNKSPNFCVSSSYSPGITGRVCNGSQGCDEMCCGRGYNTRVVTVMRSCRCEFIWCCKTICKRCKVQQEVHVCN